MNHILSYIMSNTNYNICNINNHYNFLFIIMSKLDDTQRKDFVSTMKINIGMQFTDDFKLYIFKKIPDSILLTYF